MSVPNIENNIQQNNNGGPTGNDIEITYFYQDNPSQQNYYLNSIEHPEVAFPQYFLAVSYTHLDVYKRQETIESFMVMVELALLQADCCLKGL